MKERLLPPRPKEKVRKIKGGGGRNKSALNALPKDKNPGWGRSHG